jgi:PucR family transcriptional regulator, purine catabolism regulatory protein
MLKEVEILAISLEDMLRMSNFYDLKVIAGEKGLSRKVTSVSVMDAPDIYKWLKGGEILITTGYIMRENPLEIVELIKNIDNSGAAALFVKLKRFIDYLPDEVIDIANELNFPVVSMPIHLAFTDIINPVLSQIVNEQARKLQHSENIHNSFTQLVISGGDTQQIINTLRHIIQKDIAYYDTYFEKVYCSSHSEDFENDITNLTLDKVLLKYKSYLIKIDKKVYGYIVYSSSDRKDNMQEYDEIAIEHAGTVLKLDVQKKISNLQIEYNHRNEFVQDLIMNNIKFEKEVQNRADLYGWNFNKGLIVVIVDIDDFKTQYLKINQKEFSQSLEDTREKIFNVSRKVVKSFVDTVIYTAFSDSIVFLIEPWNKDMQIFKKELRKMADEIRKTVLENYKFSATIGIGTYKKCVIDVHISYSEALQSVKLGRIVYKKNKTVFYDELGTYKLLTSIYQSNEATEFYISCLGKLLEYDRKNNSKLIETLYIIARNDWNLKLAAEEMFIHYNTIKYRLKKINELLEEDTNNSEVRLKIAISLKLMKMCE